MNGLDLGVSVYKLIKTNFRNLGNVMDVRIKSVFSEFTTDTRLLVSPERHTDLRDLGVVDLKIGMHKRIQK